MEKQLSAVTAMEAPKDSSSGEGKKEWVRQIDNAYVERDATVEEELLALEAYYGPNYFLRTDSGFKICFESPNGLFNSIQFNSIQFIFFFY